MLTGFTIRRSHNPGAGDVAHLVGLIAGYGLIAIALLWPRLNLGRFWSTVGAWITAVSLYLNWLGVIFLSVFGNGPNAASAPHFGSPLMWDHAGRITLQFAIWLSLASVIIILVGLRNLEVSASAEATTVAAKG